jgi:hypothetical protein
MSHWREFGSLALCVAKLVSADIRRFVTGIQDTTVTTNTSAT